MLALFLAVQVSAGLWGGAHVLMEVTSDGAQLEFDCATGTITEPLQTDAQGRFSLRGTFTPEHPGPIREGEPSRTRAATYSGTIEGDTMTLQIDEQTMRYQLVRGRRGKVMKCR